MKIQKINKKLKGISFVEAIISMFMFVVIMTAITTSVTGSVAGFRKARALQKNVEAANFLLNYLAKSIRTSTIYPISGGDNTSIKVFDYADMQCKLFGLDANKRVTMLVTHYVGMNVGPETTNGTMKYNCASASPSWTSSTPQILSDQPVDLLISATPTVANDNVPANDTSTGLMGKATIRMKVCDNTECKSSAIIQTTVSLRDYEQANM